METFKVAQRSSLVLLILVSSFAVAHSQINLQAGVGGGMTIPAADYSGTTSEYYSGTKYGLSTGFNVHAKARVGIIGLRLVGEIGYSSFSNSGEAMPGQGSVDVSQNVLAFKVGPEFHFGIPLVPVTPYLGANLALNRFSGETKFQGISKVPSGTIELSAASRIGFGFSGGVLLSLGPLTSIDVGVTYDMLNASGKTWEDANATQDLRLDSYLSLNDDKDPLYKAGDDKHFIANSRTMNAFQVRATIMLGI
jgi:hypothetical protein